MVLSVLTLTETDKKWLLILIDNVVNYTDNVGYIFICVVGFIDYSVYYFDHVNCFLDIVV